MNTVIHTCKCDTCKSLSFSAPEGYISGTPKEVREMTHNYAHMVRSPIHAPRLAAKGVTAVNASYVAATEVRESDKVRVECACNVCKKNAAKIGATFPLAAMVPEQVAAKWETHIAVHSAHDPGVLGKTMSAQMGLVAL